MRRFFVPEIQEESGAVVVRGKEARHIARVLRLGPGDRFVLFDEKGKRCLVSLQSAGRREIVARVLEFLPPPPAAPLEFTLCQALLKSQAMDEVVRKTSELGADFIVPFTSRRTVVSLDSRQFSARKKHWMEISRSAAKQADRARPIRIGPLHSFQGMLEAFGSKDAFRVILWEGEDAGDLKGLLRASPCAKRAVGVVGPEGGFAQEEIAQAREKGFLSASLGRRVLRADTAAATLTALLQYEWGDLGLPVNPPPDNMRSSCP